MAKEEQKNEHSLSGAATQKQPYEQPSVQSHQPLEVMTKFEDKSSDLP